MESLIKLLEVAKGLTYDQIIKTVALVAILVWAGTEGREIWLDNTDEQKQDLQTELMVDFIGRNEAREDEQSELIEQVAETLPEINTAQQLSIQKFELEIERIKDDIDDLEDRVN